MKGKIYKEVSKSVPLTGRRKKSDYRRDKLPPVNFNGNFHLIFTAYSFIISIKNTIQYSVRFYRRKFALAVVRLAGTPNNCSILPFPPLNRTFTFLSNPPPPVLHKNGGCRRWLFFNIMYGLLNLSIFSFFF